MTIFFFQEKRKLIIPSMILSFISAIVSFCCCIPSLIDFLLGVKSKHSDPLFYFILYFIIAGKFFRIMKDSVLKNIFFIQKILIYNFLKIFSFLHLLLAHSVFSLQNHESSRKDNGYKICFKRHHKWCIIKARDITHEIQIVISIFNTTLTNWFDSK